MSLGTSRDNRQQPRDFLGQMIKLHDLIVYPYRSRGEMILKKAIVTGFVDVEGGTVICAYDPESPLRRHKRIKCFNRCVVIKKEK